LHSFELLCRSRTRINRIVRRRFDRLCERIAAMDGVATSTYCDAAPVARTLPYPRPALPSNAIRSGARMAEQALANTLYGDRPLLPGWKARGSSKHR
jgi:hypothetical protein